METARQTAQQAHRKSVHDETVARACALVSLLPRSDQMLSQFGLRMASHSLSISSTQMRASSRYAMQQLDHARAIHDDRLQLLAARMFHLFESYRSGAALASH